MLIPFSRAKPNLFGALLGVISMLGWNLPCPAAEAPGQLDPNYTGPSAPTVLLPQLSLSAEKDFVHPGLLQSQGGIDFVRAKIKAGEEPWTSALKALKADPLCSLGRKPKAVPEPIAGTNSSGAPMFDGSAAYGDALLWCILGDKRYADKAIEILNANASILRVISGPKDGGKLLAGFTGGKFANAAELLIHCRQPDGSTANWSTNDVDKFRTMLKTVFYPPIANFEPGYNGNWDASMVSTMMGIAVVCDDHEMFNRGVDYYLHGPGHGSISHYLYSSGQSQETVRDQSHVQLGLSALASAAEIAWRQGLDLYGMADNRLATAFEYEAKFGLGNDVETLNNVPPGPGGRGRFMPGYELVYQHYAIEKGIPMPYTAQVLGQHRPEGSDMIVTPAWGTLASYQGPGISAPTPAEK